jgi:hypothetical protein
MAIEHAAAAGIVRAFDIDSYVRQSGAKKELFLPDRTNTIWYGHGGQVIYGKERLISNRGDAVWDIEMTAGHCLRIADQGGQVMAIEPPPLLA